ncbi:MALARIA ANTIGEN-RELATED [Salix purpurea]|uniref:MALARIA ANTIGEN-RELATED n=1 Tax=Salix purpurea TaxID=77065 RepID=A0A9Q1A055_SALPP|nr:MALARIA ANTIGEN-RELATED [Salix purpurea]
MSTPSSSAMQPPIIRTWRTAFLTLRDETLTTRSPKSESESLPQLLRDLLFSSPSLLSAASDLPSHEITSDLIFLLELAANSSQDFTSVYPHISHLVYDVCQGQRVSLQLNSNAWSVVLDSYAKMLQFFIGKAGTANVSLAVECIATVRYFVSEHQQKCMLSDNVQLVKFLLRIVDCSRAQFVSSLYSSGNQRSAGSTGKGVSKYSSLWEVYTVAFTMLGDVFEKVGSSFSADVWQSTIEVLRKVMDALAINNSLPEDIVMSRFYSSLLNCLHLVLVDPKGSLHDHVSGFVATLRLFFIYGINSRQQFTASPTVNKEKELSSASLKLNSKEPVRKDNAPYRPPHLRKKDGVNMKQPKAQDPLCLSDHESSATDFMSSDSDCSDSDVSGKDTDGIQSSKVRVAAIVCIQDLCQADPKSFTAQWTMLLPTNDVLQQRKFEATLMTSLLYDPYLKVRIASASTMVVMLDGPSSVFLQVAEYKESTKWGSFMALSSSLGQILMQLHTGILHLIQRETHSRLLASVFKILMLLISSTPYSRMPEELLPRAIASLLEKAENGFPFKSNQTGLLASAISCLTAAFSTSPSSPQVKQMLIEEISTGAVEAGKRSGVIFTLFRLSEQPTNPTVCFETLQTLRAVIHSYPNIASACWERVSIIVSKILRAASLEAPVRMWKGHAGDGVGFIGEKIVTAAVKVLDECLRAISGFKGTEDIIDDKLMDTPFTSDFVRMKKVSSAPSYESESAEDIKDEQKTYHSGREHWSEAIEKHISMTLRHTSTMVRTSAITCFAGITSSVFFSLPKEKQEFIVSSLINAVNDGFDKVQRSLTSLSMSLRSTLVIPLVSVRITASWALANICDSLRHCIDEFPLKKYTGALAGYQSVASLTESALRLTEDGDKIKSNAVRALGNLSRFVKYTNSSGSSAVHDKPVGYLDSSSNNIEMLSERSSLQHAPNYRHPTSLGDSHLLERMVQTFLSCVTTGNVKVQWNVCHALSNLFLNETLRLQDMDWAPSVFSVLLLLLRDSSNFKIRIQAAAALAVSASAFDYGNSFSDVVQGLEHILQNLGSDQISAPSNFKYRVALEKQVTATMLHVLSLASSADHQPLKDFLVKKAPFLEEWFKGLCSSLGETSSQSEAGSSIGDQKKLMISKAIQSLIEVYESRNHQPIVQKFKKLSNSIQL